MLEIASLAPTVYDMNNNTTTNNPRKFASTQAAAELLERLDLVGLVADLDAAPHGLQQEEALRVFAKAATARILGSFDLEPLAVFLVGPSLFTHDGCAGCDDAWSGLDEGETWECEQCGATVGSLDEEFLARFCTGRGRAWFEFTRDLLSFDTVQIVDAVLHEAAHAVVHGTDFRAHLTQAPHGKAFKDTARKLGAQPRASVRRDLRALDA